MDPASTDFIAPGNIYRVLAVVSPTEIGLRKWFGLASKALICAYMQLYIPVSILKNEFEHWHLTGVKSPIWFMENDMAFAASFGALASVCTLFTGRCAQQVRTGAAANRHILTHMEPPASGANEGASLLGIFAGVPGAGDLLASVPAAPGFLAAFPAAGDLLAAVPAAQGLLAAVPVAGDLLAAVPVEPGLLAAFPASRGGDETDEESPLLVPSERVPVSRGGDEGDEESPLLGSLAAFPLPRTYLRPFRAFRLPHRVSPL
mmetsp:Transcript_27867/g.89743  ORF Transcript_27867/g.89743 Transcript_27867/m.89743 type:complete len:261 (+) Transcript_27867:98-880(+)